MATITTMGYTSPATRRVGRSRALGVAGATLAALAVWTLAVPLLGTQLLVRFGDGPPQSVGIYSVVGATLLASLLGWGSIVVLERRTLHARTLWTGVAVVIGLVSLSLPLTAGTTTSARAALALMHLAVAAVLIPALRRGSPTQRRIRTRS